MTLLNQIKKNNGRFQYEDFAEDVYAYECVLSSLLKHKHYQVAYNMLKCYADQYQEITDIGSHVYRPGYDFIQSAYLFYEYGRMLETGIKGVVKKNKKEATKAYLTALKRYPEQTISLQNKLLKKRDLLLKHAYPDMFDLYVRALYYVGRDLYDMKKYEEAIKFFKKASKFDYNGRQICYPFAWVGKNQSKVGDMYRLGLGVKRNIRVAKYYYEKAASNCGLHHHPRLGDFLMEKGDYSLAFIRYTERNPYYPYYISFLYEDDVYAKYDEIYDHLISKVDKNEFDLEVLAMMYALGLGVEKDEEKYNELLPQIVKDRVINWVNRYEEYGKSRKKGFLC